MGFIACRFVLSLSANPAVRSSDILEIARNSFRKHPFGNATAAAAAVQTSSSKPCLQTQRMRLSALARAAGRVICGGSDLLGMPGPSSTEGLHCQSCRRLHSGSLIKMMISCCAGLTSTADSTDFGQGESTAELEGLSYQEWHRERREGSPKQRGRGGKLEAGGTGSAANTSAAPGSSIETERT